MKIALIGNGGAFHFDQTNSSFLVHTSDDTFLLVDCGRNVIDKLHLMDQDETNVFTFSKLKYVYITHMDDDHIGSLKSLIYFMFFSVNKKLLVLCNNLVKKDLVRYLRDLDGYMENYEKINELLYIPVDVPNISAKNLFPEIGLKIDGGIKLCSIEAKHHVNCMGLVLSHIDGGVTISGDTTELAIPKLGGPVRPPIKGDKKKPKILFQDFSAWNCPDKQVHLCYSWCKA